MWNENAEQPFSSKPPLVDEEVPVAEVPYEMLRIHFLYGFVLTGMPPGIIDRILGQFRHAGKDRRARGVFPRAYHLDTTLQGGFGQYLRVREDAVILRRTEGPEHSDGDDSGDKGVETVIEAVPQPMQSPTHGLVTDLIRRVYLSACGIGGVCFTLSFYRTPKHGRCRRPRRTLRETLDLLLIAEKRSRETGTRRFRLALRGLKNPRTLPELFDEEVQTFRKLLARVLGSDDRARIRWLEREGNSEFRLPPLGRSDSPSGGDGSYENPYVLVEMEAESTAAYRTLINPKSAAKSIVGHILVRIGSSGIRHWGLNRDYLEHHGVHVAGKKNVLRNFYPSDYLFVNLHFRSALMAYPPRFSKEGKPIHDTVVAIQRGLLHTLLLLRTRWRFLVVHNAYLLQLLEFLYGCWWDHGYTKDFPRVMERIVDTRLALARSLENPAPALRSSSCLKEVYDEGCALFDLSELAASALERMQQFKAFFDDCVLLDRLAQREAARKIG